MDDDLLKERLTRLILMRERKKEEPAAGEVVDSAGDCGEINEAGDALLKENLTRLVQKPPVMQQPLKQQSRKRSLIQQVKAEVADEGLEVKDEITDADALKELCQAVSSSSAADADASNAADAEITDAEEPVKAEEPEADADASEIADASDLTDAEEPEADDLKAWRVALAMKKAMARRVDEEGHGEFDPSAAAHAGALKAWRLSNVPWRRESPSSAGDQQAASSSGDAQRGNDNADRVLTSSSTGHADRERPSVDESPAHLSCAHPQCHVALDSAECSFCTVHCEWRWPTADAPLCQVHWDYPQRCQTPFMFCTAKGPKDTSKCQYCRPHCPDADSCDFHCFPAEPSGNRTRGKRATARYESSWSGAWSGGSWSDGGWGPAHPPKLPRGRGRGRACRY
jgi:hypothetical protein